jgi:uncharacterized protein (DUF1778 family)
MRKNIVKKTKRAFKRALSNERIDLRVSGENKSILIKAAELSGLGSTNSFVLTAAVTTAHHVIEEHDGILTTERARKSFFEALENPSAPNQALKAAFKKHHEVTSNRLENAL